MNALISPMASVLARFQNSMIPKEATYYLKVNIEDHIETYFAITDLNFGFQSTWAFGFSSYQCISYSCQKHFL
jgi:hypothetical protein